MLDVCCCVDAARHQIAPEEAHKQKQAQRPRPAAAKPVSVTAQLAAARAKVQMQERKLQRAKVEQQAAKYGFRIPRGGKGDRRCTVSEEGNATSIHLWSCCFLS